MKPISEYDFNGITIEDFTSYLKDFINTNGARQLNDNSRGETLLHYAVTQDTFLPFAMALINAGANWWSIKNQEQQTVIQLADDSLISENFEKLVNAILEKANAYSKQNLGGFKQLNGAAELLIEFADEKTTSEFEKAGKEFFGKLPPEDLFEQIDSPSKAEQFAAQPTKQRVFDKAQDVHRNSVVPPKINPRFKGNYSVRAYSKQLFVDNQKSFPNARVLLEGIKFLCKQLESIFSTKDICNADNLTGLKDFFMRLNDITYKLSSFKKLAKAFSTNIAAKEMINAFVNIKFLYEMDPDFYQNHVINKQNISREDLHEFMSIMKEIAKNHVQYITEKITEKLTDIEEFKLKTPLFRM